MRGSDRHGQQWFNWIIRRNDTAEVIGYVQATVTDGCAELAWLIGVDHQRLGFALEASNAMLVHLAATSVSHFSAHIAVGRAVGRHRPPDRPAPVHPDR